MISKALSVRPPWAQMIIYGISLYKKADTGRDDGSYMIERSGQYVLKDIDKAAVMGRLVAVFY